MAAKGQKKVSHNGREAYLSAEDARVEELIDEIQQLNAQERDLKEAKAEVRADVLELASERPGAGQTVTLEGVLSGRTLVITWPKKTVVNESRAERLREKLDPETWGAVFTERRKLALNTGYRDTVQFGRLTPARQRAVATAFSVAEAGARVTVREPQEGAAEAQP